MNFLRVTVEISLLCASLGIYARSQDGQTAPSQLTRSEKDAKLVERDYYTIPYAMQLTVLTDAARQGQGRIDESRIQPLLTAAAMDISVTDIKSGPTSDILTQPLTDFVSVPQLGQDVLIVDVLKASDGDPYGSIKARWTPMTKDPDAPDPSILKAMSIEQFLALEGDLNGTNFARYAAVNVSVRFQGRSVNYKAMYLFPVVPEDPTMLVHVDMFLQGTRYSQFQLAFRPDMILRSKWREIPAMQSWLSAHTVPDDTCSRSQMNQLCCLGNRCGERRSDFERKMSWPLRSSPAFTNPPEPQASLLYDPALLRMTQAAILTIHPHAPAPTEVVYQYHPPIAILHRRRASSRPKPAQ